LRRVRDPSSTQGNGLLRAEPPAEHASRPELDALAAEAFEHAPLLMGIVEPTEDGDLLHVRDNAASCKLFGLAPGGTTGRLASELGVSERTRREWLGHHDASVASGEPVRFEHTYPGPDGEETLLVAVRPLPSGPGGRPRFLYVGENITARKRAEAARAEASLLATQSELDAIVSGMSEGLNVADLDGTVRRMNPAALTLLGYSSESEYRRRLPEFTDTWEISDLDGRLLPLEEWPFARVLRGEELSDCVVRVRRRDTGLSRILSHNGRIVRQERGRPFAILTFRDVTKMIEAEEALRAADRRKDEFLATLAHELRNPLAPIRNAVQILKTKGPTDPTLMWGRDVIDRQVRHMARLLEDLLDVSRISRDKLELRRERVDIASVVDVAIETSRPAIDAGHHRLTVSVPPTPIFVDADPVRLAQVFANLLNNAAKYTPDQGNIALTVEPRDDRVVVSVKDDGIGISADMLPRVFELFSQAAPAASRAQGGLGIGLSLVKGIVRLHGGTVTARSEGPGRGSELVVELPANVPPSSREAPEAAKATGPLKDRVLVVDDNADSADTLAALLELLGCDVKTAYGGEQALALADTFRPTVVLLDIGMPGLSGYEVCQRLRAQLCGRPVLIVAMTGRGQAEDRERTREAGFDSHMVKPIDPAALTRLLADQPGRPKAG
jgi:PAS domain S-box-containing protein